MGIVDTSKTFDFIWLTWQVFGIYPVLEYKAHHYLHIILIFVLVNVVSVAVFVMKLFYVTDLKYLLDNLPMNIIALGTALKVITVFLMRRRICGIKDSLAKLDKYEISEEQEQYLQNLIKFCNRLFICGSICYEGVDTMAAINAAFSKRERLLFEIWLPYDWRATALRYWMTFAYQYFAQSVLAFQSVASDFTGPIYLMVLTAHLRHIMNRIQNLQYNPRKSDQENAEELIRCFQDHRIVTEIFEVLQGTVSYIILVQIVGTVTALVMILLNYMLFSSNLTEVLALLIFAVAEILQILPCCYYSNKFMWTTDQVVTSLYSSNWYNQPMKVKKILIIFMQMTQKNKVIVAGKIIPVTVSTFVSILKFSYSLLMVLIRVNH